MTWSALEYASVVSEKFQVGDWQKRKDGIDVKRV